MTDKPELTCTQTDDATVWAKEFCEINPSMDESNMLGWFANAIECSSDIRRRKWDDIAAAREHKIKEEALTRQIEYEKRGNDCINAWMQKALDATGAQRIAEIALNCRQERELAIIRATLEAAKHEFNRVGRTAEDCTIEEVSDEAVSSVDPATILNNIEVEK